MREVAKKEEDLTVVNDFDDKKENKTINKDILQKQIDVLRNDPLFKNKDLLDWGSIPK